MLGFRSCCRLGSTIDFSTVTETVLKCCDQHEKNLALFRTQRRALALVFVDAAGPAGTLRLTSEGSKEGRKEGRCLKKEMCWIWVSR